MIKKRLFVLIFLALRHEDSGGAKSGKFGGYSYSVAPKNTKPKSNVMGVSKVALPVPTSSIFIIFCITEWQNNGFNKLQHSWSFVSGVISNFIGGDSGDLCQTRSFRVYQSNTAIEYKQTYTLAVQIILN